MWATQEKLINCDMEEIIRADRRRGRILEDRNLSPKSMEKSGILSFFRTVLLSNLTSICVDLFTSMIMASHGWNFASGEAELTLSLNNKLLLSKGTSDIMNTSTHTYLESTWAKGNLRA